MVANKIKEWIKEFTNWIIEWSIKNVCSII